MNKLKDVLQLRKAKYLKRKGSPGHYKYFYKETPVKAERKVIARRELIKRGQKYGLSALVDELRSSLKQSPKAIPTRILAEVVRLMKRDKAEMSYHWLRGFMSPDGRTFASEEKAKAMYSEMRRRKLIKSEKLGKALELRKVNL